ncbi:MAG: KEOPS complex subunit Cgi121 [Candidatus Micrarchaeaceae archaeon]
MVAGSNPAQSIKGKSMQARQLESIEKNAFTFRASSKMELERLFGIIEKDVALIDPYAVISRKHLIVAYANAVADFFDNRNIANGIGMETLLYIAFTYQISEAVKIAGAKDKSNFVAFCGSDASCKKFLAIDGVKAKKYMPKKEEKMHAENMYKIASEMDIMKKMALLKLSRG